MLLFNFCDCHWIWPWLLPFLLGLALGWLLWAKYKAMVADLEKRITDLEGQLNDCQEDLAKCRSKRAELEGDLATCRGRLREVELALKECQENADSGNISNIATNLGDSRGSDDGGDSGDSGGSDDGSSGVFPQAFTPTPAPPQPEPAEDVLTPPPATSGKKSAFDALSNDNLQIVEGIGPKMESVLHENGVRTWADLAGNSEADIKAILGKYGDRYRIIDPASWNKQAALARDEKWEELITLQKALDTGRGDTGNTQTDSKLEKLMIKLGLMKKYAMNDLKAVEGIGPKIAQLLQNAGINTWRELANTSVERIQGILNDAGSRYKLADPSTWPKQSELAADGKWDELKEYQDYLQGGKG